MSSDEPPGNGITHNVLHVVSGRALRDKMESGRLSRQEDLEIQAVVDGEYDDDELARKEVMADIIRDPARLQRMGELMEQKRMLCQWWRQNRFEH